MKLAEDKRKLLKVSTLYYQENLTQAEIAQKMGFSRPVVSKMLQQARESGIVEIFIKEENAYCIELGILLEKKYQLTDAIVIPVSREASEVSLKSSLSRAASGYLLEQLPKVKSIGLSWGTTLADVIQEMPYVSYPEITVTPLVGGISSKHLYYDTNHLAFRLSEKLNSRCRYFYAPALAETKEVAQVLLKTQMISEALTVAKSVDFALIGVGNPNTSSTWKRLGYIKPDEFLGDGETDIAGDAVASLFDKNGKTSNNEITKRLIGIKVEDLAAIPEVMIVAEGVDKTESIHSLLVDNYCTVLVVDQLIAEKLV